MSEEALNSLVEASPLAIFDLDPGGRVKSIWNRAAEDIFGWAKEEVLGSPLPIVPEGKSAEFNRLRKRVFEGDSFSGVEVVRQRKDNSEIEVSISTAPMRDNSGRIIGIMSVVEDISSRKQLERSVRESEKKFREIFNGANDAIYLHRLTKDGMPVEFVEVNDVACSMLGYTREELLSIPPLEIYAGGQAEELPAIMKEMLSRGSKTFEMEHRARDGTGIPVEVSSRTINLNDEELILSIARNISVRIKTERELTKNQERLEAALKSGNLAWWQMELPSGKIEFSPLKAEMLGYNPDRFATYKDFVDLVHPEDRDRAMKAMEAYLEGEEKRYEVEYRIKKENGDYKWFRDVGSLTEQQANYRQITGVVIDIDRRKEAEIALEVQQAKLKGLHKAVDVFQHCSTEKDLCEAAVEATKDVLDFDLCTFYCADGSHLVPVAATEDMEPDKLNRQDIDEGLAGRAYQRKQSIFGDDLQEEDKAATNRSDLRGYLSIPIGDVGVFQAASHKRGGFDERDRELAEILAGHLNEEVKRIRLEGKLRVQAIRDPLTGLYNRRYFNETLGNEIERSERYGHNIAFLIADVNGFKEINDRYSHQTGDRVLCEVARLITENLRDADTVVRYGGDEFLVMMPETNGDSKSTVDRLRRKIDEWNSETDILDYPLGLSFGVSHWNPDQDRGIEKALQEADSRMYKDKENKLAP